MLMLMSMLNKRCWFSYWTSWWWINCIRSERTMGWFIWICVWWMPSIFCTIWASVTIGWWHRFVWELVNPWIITSHSDSFIVLLTIILSQRLWTFWLKNISSVWSGISSFNWSILYNLSNLTAWSSTTVWSWNWWNIHSWAVSSFLAWCFFDLSVESSSSSSKSNWLWECWVVWVQVVWKILSVSWEEVVDLLWCENLWCLFITHLSKLDSLGRAQEEG